VVRGVRFILSKANADGSIGNPKDLLGTLGAVHALNAVAGDLNGVVSRGLAWVEHQIGPEGSLFGDPFLTALYLDVAWKFKRDNRQTPERIQAQRVSVGSGASLEGTAKTDLPAGEKKVKPRWNTSFSGSVPQGKPMGTGLPSINLSGVSDGLCTVQDVTPEIGESSGTIQALLDNRPYTLGTPITDEGEHVLIVGAEGSGIQTVRFVIDRTAPVVNVSGVVEGDHVKGAVTPKISVTDKNLDGLEMTLDGEAYQQGTPVVTVGKHLLIVTAWECAGNLEEKSVSFAVEGTR
jgi:hypothetical protein